MDVQHLDGLYVVLGVVECQHCIKPHLLIIIPAKTLPQDAALVGRDEGRGVCVEEREREREGSHNMWNLRQGQGRRRRWQGGGQDVGRGCPPHGGWWKGRGRRCELPQRSVSASCLGRRNLTSSSPPPQICLPSLESPNRM